MFVFQFRVVGRESEVGDRREAELLLAEGISL
jgi:hypothetical protein